MRFKLNFSPNTEPLTKPINDSVNGFIHKCLGENNKWHNSFSPYCVSQMQGGVFDPTTGMIQYPNGGFLIISVDKDETEFITALLNGLVTMSDGYIQTMRYEGFSSYTVNEHDKFDIVRISCVRLMDGKRAVTCKDDNFLQFLTDHTVKKLKRCGVSDNDAESITLEPFHKENWKVKFVKLKNYNEFPVVTPASNVMIIVKGNRAARKKLLSIGYGQSTGCGFGFPKMKEDNVKISK